MAGDEHPTRRNFFRQSAALAAAALTARGRSSGREPQPTTSAVVRDRTAGRVVELSNEHVVSGRTVHHHLLREMLERGIAEFFDQPSVTEGWRTLLKDDDVIALKFNQSGAAGIGTTSVFARVLVASLLAADFRPDQLVLLELPAGVIEQETRRPPQGWTQRIYDFGSGRDRLMAVVEEVTAIINIPFLKTHNIAGMSGCLKNLSHALVRHPGRFHANGCDPYVADIISLPAVRDRLKLHVVDALRVVSAGGPDAREANIDTAGTVLISRDPVAADTVGQDILDARRLVRGLPRLADDSGKLPILATAARKGLGMNDPDALDHVKVRM
jgi:hypothetical protein